jgi:hypothetical protein
MNWAQAHPLVSGNRLLSISMSETSMKRNRFQAIRRHRAKAGRFEKFVAARRMQRRRRENPTRL